MKAFFLKLPLPDEELPLLQTDHTSKKGTPYWLAFALKTVVRQLLSFQSKIIAVIFTEHIKRYKIWLLLPELTTKIMLDTHKKES